LAIKATFHKHPEATDPIRILYRPHLKAHRKKGIFMPCRPLKWCNWSFLAGGQIVGGFVNFVNIKEQRPYRQSRGHTRHL
jgi:hypothetical protein